MLLAELVDRSGVSAASIKYYRREGLLPPGDRVTTTRQAYGERHLDRLRLIGVLRERADASIPDVRALVEVLDDPHRPLVDALELAQAITSGLPAAPHRRPVPDDEDPAVTRVVRELGWPDVPSGPRAAVDDLARSVRAAGIPVDPARLVRWARHLDELAREDLDRAGVTAPARTGAPAEDGSAAGPSDDAIVTHAVAGMVASDRLLRTLRAWALASGSIARATPPATA